MQWENEPIETIFIDDPDDPRVAAYRDIRERDLTGHQGLFIAEGEVVVRGLASKASRCRPLSLLLAEKRVAALGDVITSLPPATPVYVAGQTVLDRIAAARSLTKAQLLAEIDAGRGRRPLASACRLLALDWVADHGRPA